MNNFLYILWLQSLVCLIHKNHSFYHRKVARIIKV